MFFPEGQLRVYLYGQPADLRRSFDGLQALVRQGLGEDPLDGGLYVFINRRGTQIRVLYFDRSGFCLWAKRLEAGRFVSNWRAVRTREMDWTGLKLLLEGIEPARQRKRYRLTSSPQNSVHTPMHTLDSAHGSARSGKLINDTS
jgi:transposase